MSITRREYWLVLITSLVAIGFSVIFVARHLVNPSDGARLEPGGNALVPEGVIVTPLRTQAGGLMAGDLVVAVEGHGMESWAKNLLRMGEPSPIRSVGDTLTYTVIRESETLDIRVTLGRYPFWQVAGKNWGTILFALVYLLVTTFVFIRRPENKAGVILFLTAAGLVSSTAWSFGLQASDFMDGIGFWLFKICTLLFYNLYWTASFHFALIFPRPLSVLDHRGFLPALYGLPYVLLAIYLAIARFFSNSLLDWFSRWTVAEGVHAAVFLSATLVALLIQYRSNRTGAARQQIRWVVLAGLLSGGAGLLLYILPGALGLGAIDPNATGLTALLFPLAVGIAILRHNLFDIDTLINRTLVYGALSASTIALYVLIVGYFGNALQARERTLIAFLATGLVAVIFQPLRIWLQQRVNRWMYGERDDPYKVLAGLSQRLGMTLLPEKVLPTLTETVATTLKLPYAAITLFRPGEKNDEATAAYGLPKEPILRLPLVHQGEIIGDFIVSQRTQDEPFTNAEVSLLEDIATQASAAAYSVRLTDDLQRSRERLIAAREEERRRIRRDLHDGLGPQLASQTLTLSAARRLLSQDPEAADELLKEAIKHAQAATEDVRRVVYDLRPPALDDLGLIEAILAQAQRFESSELKIDLQVPDSIPSLPAAVEVACLLIFQEALTNVIRHSKAACCTVTLEITKDVELEIYDDGEGIPRDRRAGVGLNSMRLRAEELGGTFKLDSPPQGGTRIIVRLPLRIDED